MTIGTQATGNESNVPLEATLPIGAARNERNVPLEATLPIGAASLASILLTEELLARPSRPPDHERENSALVALVGTLADHPDTICRRWWTRRAMSCGRIRPA
jgi:hypothetical protein